MLKNINKTMSSLAKLSLRCVSERQPQHQQYNQRYHVLIIFCINLFINQSYIKSQQLQSGVSLTKQDHHHVRKSIEIWKWISMYQSKEMKMNCSKQWKDGKDSGKSISSCQNPRPSHCLGMWGPLSKGIENHIYVGIVYQYQVLRTIRGFTNGRCVHFNFA